MKKSRNISKKYLEETLHFPVFKGSLPEPPPLGMDEYYAFVTNNLKWFKEIRTRQASEKAYPVGARFQLKGNDDVSFEKDVAAEPSPRYRAKRGKGKSKKGK